MGEGTEPAGGKRGTLQARTPGPGPAAGRGRSLRPSAAPCRLRCPQRPGPEQLRGCVQMPPAPPPPGDSFPRHVQAWPMPGAPARAASPPRTHGAAGPGLSPLRPRRLSPATRSRSLWEPAPAPCGLGGAAAPPLPSPTRRPRPGCGQGPSARLCGLAGAVRRRDPGPARFPSPGRDLQGCKLARMVEPASSNTPARGTPPPANWRSPR